MRIVRIYMNNSLQNYSYLLICDDTQEAILLDPFDASSCLEEADKQGCSIKIIINTHEHFDHIQGNPEVVEHTGALIYAHKNAVDSIPNVYKALVAGDSISLGSSIALRVLDTPGHTLAHVCLLSESSEPALFSGDTLFNAGAGNCRGGGDVHLMYQTFSEQLANLPEETKIYPGHDYIMNNLKFTLDREPSNQYAQELLKKVSLQTPETRMVSTLAEEKRMNTFFRLDAPEVLSGLKEKFPEQQENPEAVFIGLRALRDHW